MRDTLSLAEALNEYDLYRATDIARKLINKPGPIKDCLEKWTKSQGTDTNKYLFVDRFLRRYLYMAQTLLLHKRKNLRVLDIGTGMGWMSWLVKELGNEPLGIDIPIRESVYKDMCKAMECKVIEHWIKPYEPLPLAEKADIVISLSSAFYLGEIEWQAKDFDFFLNDLESHLNDKHIILFDMNLYCASYYNREIYDVFDKHGYRMVDSFCIKISKYSKNDTDFIFNHLARWTRIQSSPYFSIWHSDYLPCALRYPGRFLDILLKDFNTDLRLWAHKGLFHALKNERLPAIEYMEKAAVGDPQCTGYSIALAQLHMLENDKPSAIKAIKRLIQANNADMIAKEWIKALSSTDETSLSCVSPYWRDRHHIVSNSSIFKEMLSSNPELQSQRDPASWYLTHGAMGCTLGSFTPVLYWGLYDEVFRSGLDPLVHYEIAGKKRIWLH